MTAIAFIGLGSMGAPQARLIARNGFTLTVFDPSPAAVEPFRGIARIASSSKDAAQGADILCVCVRDDGQVDEVLFGDAGAAASLAAGAMVVIHSTIRADTLRSIRDKLAQRDIKVIDAAVSRTRMRDDDPFVISLVGGSEEEIEHVRPVLAAFSTEILHVGPAGAGVAAKIANNMITWTHIVVGTQAAAMAVANGVSLEQLRTILQANGNLTPPVSSMFEGLISTISTPERDALLQSQAGIGQKDLTLASESLSAAGLDPQLAMAGRALVPFAMGGGHG